MAAFCLNLCSRPVTELSCTSWQSGKQELGQQPYSSPPLMARSQLHETLNGSRDFILSHPQPVYSSLAQTSPSNDFDRYFDPSTRLGPHSNVSAKADGHTPRPDILDEIWQQGKQPLPTQAYSSPSTMAAIIQPQPQPSTSSRDLTLSHSQAAHPSPALAVGRWPCAPSIHTSAKTTWPGPHNYSRWSVIIDQSPPTSTSPEVPPIPPFHSETR
ncbi:hypothetical protein TEQG_07167 [Trichophyton equinum CBS 127.97]|uniref:Uncharacterized protein n=1 Tax=Trichophyton equinum (strain ATCC MYA-4606 / CBS 127.97) TaxID=559882 RepID=F2Q272_TRIEC|nr:hypothetical protein TEQG_07167 [Trichophyton equinum CBS 127.97]